MGRVILIILLVVFIVRLFVVESYSISTAQMEDSLFEGDNVFVDKTAYGIRMPVTPLTVPFTSDRFFGRQSYSTALQLSYNRLCEKKAIRNDIVLFNNPTEIDLPLDKRSLHINRCVGLPGDSISYNEDGLHINDKYYTLSPNVLSNYRIGADTAITEFDNELALSLLEDYHIPSRDFKRNEQGISLQMSYYQSYLYNGKVKDSSYLAVREADSLNYSIRVPNKGYKIEIDKSALAQYKTCILHEQKNAQLVGDSALTINGNSVKYYTFAEDYYWLLADDTNNKTDSRQLGFIPFSHIVGRVSYIWWASDKRTGLFERILERTNDGE